MNQARTRTPAQITARANADTAYHLALLSVELESFGTVALASAEDALASASAALTAHDDMYYNIQDALYAAHDSAMDALLRCAGDRYSAVTDAEKRAAKSAHDAVYSHQQQVKSELDSFMRNEPN